MSKFLFTVAKSNKRFPNEIYKTIMKRSNLISKKMPLYIFKEAFHSSNTPPEYRTILLSSLYHDRPDFRSLIRRTTKLPSDLVNIRFQVVEGEKGQKTFALHGLRGYMPTAKGFAIKPPFNIRLTKEAKKQIQNWYPKALRQKLLTKALLSGKVQFQKVSLFAENITRCLFDLAFITKEFVFLNDPRGKYNTSPIKALVREWETAHITGYFANSATIFKSHLEHMMMQFDKYAPYLEKMGINVDRIRSTFTDLYDQLSYYKNMGFNNNTQEEEDILYEIHSRTAPFVESMIEIANKIENMDEHSPIMYGLGRLEILPEYIPYNHKSSSLSRAYEAVDVGISYSLWEFFAALDV